eukprot:5830828-Pyramimonas_sp.AAC.1
MPGVTAASHGAPPTAPRPWRTALATEEAEATAAAFLIAVAQPRSPSMTSQPPGRTECNRQCKSSKGPILAD